VVISPGSRSTPLTLAFAAHPFITSHVVVDERSAGFIALGIGMKSSSPAALVCTSGTAVANYLPAVVEAHMSGIPMLVLSADRPPSMRNIGANQAIRQAGIFGNYAGFEHDAGEPMNSDSDFRRLEILASQAWNLSTSLPGVAHINFPFRKPLEPDASFRESLPCYYEAALQLRMQSVTHRPAQTWTPPAEVLYQLSQAIRPVIIAGPLPHHGVLSELLVELEKTGTPVLREAAAGKSTVPSRINGFNSFLKSGKLRQELEPDLIIRLGAAPVGKGLELYLTTHKHIPVVCFEMGNAWADPYQNGGMRVSIPAGNYTLHLSKLPYFKNDAWMSKWQSVSTAWLSRRTKGLKGGLLLRDGDVYGAVLKNTTAPSIFMISNSFAARDADLFGMPELAAHDIFMNRGASGIDGITSTAAGLAIASDLPVTLITGDLAFLHDTTALLSVSRLAPGKKLRIIVINNAGGSIFRMLPVYELSEWFTRFFETPQSADLPALARAFGINTHEVNTLEELNEALRTNTDIQVIVCNTDAELSMNQREMLWKELN
jgi:2-succinyl-5-enolpyruvyl-6-hydroxy-3-cyclohexene-1-carboxylate synthase